METREDVRDDRTTTTITGDGTPAVEGTDPVVHDKAAVRGDRGGARRLDHDTDPTDAADATDGGGPALMEGADDLVGRWETVQTGFVDEPRRAVEQADELIGEAIRALAESFSAERQRLEGQWSRGDDVSTEDLRVALQRYRAFFQRLLATS